MLVVELAMRKIPELVAALPPLLIAELLMGLLRLVTGPMAPTVTAVGMTGTVSLKLLLWMLFGELELNDARLLFAVAPLFKVELLDPAIGWLLLLIPQLELDWLMTDTAEATRPIWLAESFLMLSNCLILDLMSTN